MPDLDARLEPILRLLRRHDLVRELAHRQSPAKPELVDSLVERQYESELRRRLAALDPADIAHLLEMLPPQPRHAVWNQVAIERAGEVLWEARRHGRRGPDRGHRRGTACCACAGTWTRTRCIRSSI